MLWFVNSLESLRPAYEEEQDPTYPTYLVDYRIQGLCLKGPFWAPHHFHRAPKEFRRGILWALLLLQTSYKRLSTISSSPNSKKIVLTKRLLRDLDMNLLYVQFRTLNFSHSLGYRARTSSQNTAFPETMAPSIDRSRIFAIRNADPAMPGTEVVID